MKIIILICILLTVFAVQVKEKQNQNQSNGAISNKYKDLKNPFGNHSLFTGHNGDNISAAINAVPPPQPEKEAKTNFEEPERQVAARLVEHYRKQFDYLDSIKVDDMLNAEELSEAFRTFEWPKVDPDIADDEEYAKTVINKYDKENKSGLNFVEFCVFAEELWEISDKLQEAKCGMGFNKAMEVWDGFFKWLDRDNDGYLVMEDMIYGVSKMMYKDCDVNEVEKVFSEYGGTEKKINYDSFVLAIANGILDKSLGDPNFTESLIN